MNCEMCGDTAYYVLGNETLDLRAEFTDDPAWMVLVDAENQEQS